MSLQRSPIAVLISDVHFSVQTLEVASLALIKAQFKAYRLKVPLVITGDFLDTKAIIRAEVANKLIQLLSMPDAPKTIILVGNHDLCNERGTEHALNFLKPYAVVVDQMQIGNLDETPVTMIPYCSNLDYLRMVLKEELTTKIIIMHQGIINSSPGHYIQDKTAIPKEWLTGKRVISGHYHNRQSFDLPGEGKFDYVGNPYTLNFAESNDPEKGYQVLHDDGSLAFVPTELRKHVVIETDGETMQTKDVKDNDIVRVKWSASSDKLSKLTKEIVARDLRLKGSFRLDLIPTDTRTEVYEKCHSMPHSAIIDSMINSLSNTDDNRKQRLKELWKQFA